jgi:Tol biopolymer transport system component
MSRARPLLTALAVLLLAGSAGAASFPPEYRFSSLVGPRVTVHFHQGLEPLARQAAAIAEEVLTHHQSRYGVGVRRLHIVLADATDDPNGFATPLPYPLVHITAASPDGSDEFGNHEGWLRLVLTHELAHIVHLEEAHGVLAFGRKLLGRAPFLFPNALTPLWMIEGLATYEETEGTAFGRGRNPDSHMVLRMAALAGQFPAEDVPSVSPDRWPGGQSQYLFGEAFLRDLTTRRGSSVLPQLARVHSGQVIPFLDDLTAQRVTGVTFHERWRMWADALAVDARHEADWIEARGLTSSRALTHRGIRQVGPRYSPDGRWIAYTSADLTHFRSIRLMRPDGGEDRKVTDRNSGSALSWTPDGRSLVYDEAEFHRIFAIYSDLRVVEVATGRVRRLTRGLRARDPDVSPDGRRVVFVRRYSDRSELWTISLDGRRLRPLVESLPQTEWSGPAWSPSGDAIVASRWRSGGWVDLVRVDPETGAVSDLTSDRAKDVEPAWTPDGRHVIFRSDRDGVSNLYALRLADRSLRRVSNVLGGAFTPAVSPDGRRIAFASYGSSGYDLHVMDLDVAALHEADPFEDPYPDPRRAPPPLTTPARGYNPLPAMLPRFWTPYAIRKSGEWQFGALTGGADPLLRHAYGLDVARGDTTGRLNVHGFYQYDGLYPTFLTTIEDTNELDAGGILQTRSVSLQATVPIARSVRSVQNASLTWKRERQDEGPVRLDLGGLEAVWVISDAKLYPYSISPVDGLRLSLAALREDPAFGSELRLTKLTADLRAYLRAGASAVLALRAGGGATFGQPGFVRSFAVGGFPDASLLDVVRSNVSVLRGYPDNAFAGRSLAYANLEARLPLGHPQRGLWSLPFFLRHLHAAAFVDAASVWTGSFHTDAVKTGVGAVVGSDLIVGHAVPLTLTGGVARGLSAGGDTRTYFRVGLAF